MIALYIFVFIFEIVKNILLSPWLVILRSWRRTTKLYRRRVEKSARYSETSRPVFVDHHGNKISSKRHRRGHRGGRKHKKNYKGGRS